MSEPQRVGVQVPVLWTGGDELPVVKVNQFLLQVDAAGDVFLTCGTATPPVLIADNPEELRKQAESLAFVPIRTTARFALTAQHVRELISVLQDGLKMLERQGTEATS